MSQITLGYWNLRGLAHCIRLLLRASDADFDEILYDENERETWTSVKQSLDLDIPNLPYLIDGETKLTQSLAILRYLGRKFNLSPESEAEKVRTEVLELSLMDWIIDGYRLWLLPKEKMEESKSSYSQSVTDRINILEKYIGSGPYVLGEKLCYVDFLLYQYLDYQRRFIPGLLNSSATLSALIKNIESIDQVKEYLNSDEFKEIDYITSKAGNWGNRNIPNHLDIE